jgi:sporulation protein YlmC with PRC-barrel domain
MNSKNVGIELNFLRIRKHGLHISNLVLGCFSLSHCLFLYFDLKNFGKFKYFDENTVFGDSQLKVSKLNGMNVITADAYTLGEVDGAHADISTWNITRLDVELTKEATEELGLKKPLFGSVTVCLPISTVKNVGDVITLNKSLIDLKTLRECKVE